ncbi:MAG TPA: ParB/RepB/Spo0J family partition protein, partial [Candidatus Kapabacteria bacterium]|nr:ParB/RepB/Spo0J family partition protein [Candidatus Kapabacteria bacterium]
MSKSKFTLGKGLGALIPGASEEPITEASESAVRLGTVAMIPLAQVAPNPQQPRKDFDPASLSELVESIRSHGIIQPITVRQTPSGGYEIISGERRVRASRLAELTEV